MKHPLLLPALVAFASSCATFDAPPEPSIVGANSGVLTNPSLPLQVLFSKPPVLSTLKLALVQFGKGDSCYSLTRDVTLFAYPAMDTSLSTATFSPDDTTMTITLATRPPAGATLAVLVEPGLADANGTVTKAQRCLTFSYKAPLNCGKAATVLHSGDYFLLTAVSEPIPFQLQLLAAFGVDPATGNLTGAFTKARRDPDPTRCSPACDSSSACRTLPGPPACVVPSTPAGSVDEYPDYVPNDDPNNAGFSFQVTGCTTDESSMTASFATDFVDVNVSTPEATLQSAQISASFTAMGDGTLRGTGSLTAVGVAFGPAMSPLGAGQGDITARSLPDGGAPPNIPQPDAGPGDGGS